jgi:miniconductance mechanosensitive channel
MNYLSEIETLFTGWGLGPGSAHLATRITVASLVVLVALTLHFAARRYLLRLLHYVIEKTSVRWDNALINHRVFQWLIHLIPAIVIHICVILVFPDSPPVVTFVRSLTTVYTVLVVCMALFGLLDATLEIYNNFKVSRSRPIKAYLQVVKIVISLIGVILSIAALVHKSPWGLLSGLGALTAVLMLVFRDSILGFVASIQLVANNMVRTGDWIEMPKYGADGDIIDVSLTTVKVQNWDKTITTIPTYALVAESFKNWRGMSESGGRRIKRSLNIDMHSVVFCNKELLEKLRKVHLLREYIEKKEEELSRHNEEHSIDQTVSINGRRLTNLGCFRAYVEAYLKSNKNIHPEMTFLVRQLQPTEQGLPIEIYVFSKEQRWVQYEGIQADIFDHLLAVLPEFELRVFQNPGGADLRLLADKRLASQT